MTITLQDPVLPRDPTSRHAFPEVRNEPKLIAPRTLAEELLTRFVRGAPIVETSFELESHGGYARTVSGKVAYLDTEAQTFMVRQADGALTRVPLRDVVSEHTDPSSEDHEPKPGRDLQGLGTGDTAVLGLDGRVRGLT
jgi:hypothetical protein